MEKINGELKVRPFEEVDKGALLDLLKEVWSYEKNIETKFKDRWWWQFERPPLWVVEDTHRVGLVGVCGYLPFSLRIGGQEQNCAWLLDFFVRSSYQGRGLGKRLTTLVQQQFPITASLSQSAAAYGVFRARGWSERSFVKLFVHPLPMRSLFLLGRTSSRILRVERQPWDPSAKAQCDGLWGRLRDTYPILAVRDYDQLAKRFASTPERKYVLFLCTRGGECVGYLVARISRPIQSGRVVGLIVDYLVPPDEPDVFTSLLAYSSNWLLEQGAKRLYCASTVPSFQRVMTRRGFLSSSTPLLRRVLTKHDLGITYFTPLKPDPVRLDQWYCTLGDCDLDSAWYQD